MHELTLELYHHFCSWTWIRLSLIWYGQHFLKVTFPDIVLNPVDSYYR